MRLRQYWGPSLLLLAGLAGPVTAQSPDFVISVEDPPERARPAVQNDLMVQFERDVEPFLNAHGWVKRGPGTPLEFRAWSNYTQFIERGEIRIILPGARDSNEPLAVLPVKPGGIATWSLGASAEGEVDYTYRVYDSRGRIDETRPKRLILGQGSRPNRGDLLFHAQENALKRQTIPVDGSAVTVSGGGVFSGERVLFAGQDVPVDANGRFSSTQFLPEGPQIVSVEIVDGDGRILRQRAENVAVADEDFFYVALADVTVGKGSSSGPVASVTGIDQFDGSVFVDGRIAFYLKGKIRGDWLLTASADTGEGPVEDLFNNFLDRDPRSVLGRIDPNAFYPVYGDASTLVDDAPSDGKVYVRLQKGANDVLWGNFRTTETQNELTGFSRALYGARLKSGTEAVTESGARRGAIEVFAAEPGTEQSRQEFRGTGGSLYYLRNRDILRGSEQVWIETRDPVTGIVLQRQELRIGDDYDVNAFQGQLQLKNPLLASGRGSTLVAGSSGKSDQFLVVTYEYSPGLSAPNDLVVGAVGSYWISERLRLGASALRQNGSAQAQTLGGVDVTYHVSDATTIRLEAAQSKDQGTATLRSLDGGFSFTTLPNSRAGTTARAGRLDVDTQFETETLKNGVARLTARHREGGFSGPGQQTDEDISDLTAQVSADVGERLGLGLKVDATDAPSQTVTAVEGNVSYRLREAHTISIGVKADDVTTNTASASPSLSTSGRRVDGQLRYDYEPLDANWSGFAFGQTTLDRSGGRVSNNRFGLGGEWNLNDRLTLGGEVSNGDGGLAARITGSWAVDDRSRVYTSYELSNDRESSTRVGQIGQFTLGGETRLSDRLSLLAEQTYQHGDGPRGRTNLVGLDYAPNDSWVLGSKIEVGDLTDPVSGDLDRRSVSFSSDYHADDYRYSGVLEYRLDRASGKRNSWTTRHSVSYDATDDWTLLSRLDYQLSSDTAVVQDTEFAEFILGAAYRPTQNDRWNALFRYQYLYDSGAAGQLSSNNAALDYAQRSHVLSADVTYQISPKLALGGKIGGRIGEIRDLTTNGPWVKSDAMLGIIRADYRMTSTWDMLGEYRVLWSDTGQNSTQGGLIAIYKRFKENVKLGLGYNATDFSDDLTNQGYHARGWFANLLATY